MGKINLDDLENILMDDLNKLGLNLYDIEYTKEPAGNILRVYIDKEGGVGVDDCSKASQKLSKSLDESEAIDAKYFLEVSSPGIERRLRRPKHFMDSINCRVSLKTKSSMEGRKKFEGIIKDASDSGLTLDLDGQTLNVDYDEISKANLIAEF
ncbi:MAG: ribosome maturation factor RimP [Actinomycetota bacterium]|nr:ribosome maturation factor RimP [Actinomycetota bacterium]